MCGIVGYVGKKQAKSHLLEGLSRLEYRGYDSSGVAFVSPDSLVVMKAPGKIASLREKIPLELDAATGIAHTRWATHGIPNEVNAHPHSDCKKNIAIVHNGIIENYKDLRAQLKKEGHTFSSETDSEVIAHLVEKYYENDLRTAVLEALKHIRGTYGLIVCHMNHPGRLIAARMGSPLILGIGNGENFIASDVSALVGRTDNVVYVNDGEVLDVTDSQFEILDQARENISRSPEKITWSLEQAERGGFESFMLKEIFEEPEAVRNAIAGRIDESSAMPHFGGLKMSNEELRAVERIIILGCGSALYAGNIGKHLIEKFAGIPIEVEVASEFRYRNPIVGKNTLALIISQSGETADTLAAMREAKQRGAKALGIINVVGSTIAREADGGVYIHAGPECAVASTKAFVGQVTVLTLLAILLGRLHTLSVADALEILSELKQIPEKIEKVLEQKDSIRSIAQKFSVFDNFFYLGRGALFPVASEGALKLKEVSYIHAESYPIAEMKHGPIALIDANFPSVIMMPDDEFFEKNQSNMQEIKARGGKSLVFTTRADAVDGADVVVHLPATHESLLPLVFLPALHLFAYYAAAARGRDIDRPRNLAKSVTVE